MTDDWHNPYFAEVAGGVTVGGDRGGFTMTHIEVKDRRHELVEKYAWAIPNFEALETIAEHGPILEVGAGRGYWAYLLRQMDVDIIATDPNPAPNTKSWSAVWKAEAQSVVPDYPDRTLMIVWPRNTNQWPTAALGMYDGETVIYVGEGRGGCTGPERFHQMLYDDWNLERVVAIPSYLGIKDRLEVWQR